MRTRALLAYGHTATAFLTNMASSSPRCIPHPQVDVIMADDPHYAALPAIDRDEVVRAHQRSLVAGEEEEEREAERRRREERRRKEEEERAREKEERSVLRRAPPQCPSLPPAISRPMRLPRVVRLAGRHVLSIFLLPLPRQPPTMAPFRRRRREEEEERERKREEERERRREEERKVARVAGGRDRGGNARSEGLVPA